MSPCMECSHRSITPNCHADCEQYLLYVKYRQRIRNARHKEQQITSVLIDGARKIKLEKFRRHRR